MCGVGWRSGTDWRSNAQWKNLGDVRRAFPHADGVKVGSGKLATVFNVCGNKHRMITAIHYNTGKIFILRLMSHAEYSKDQWKDSYETQQRFRNNCPRRTRNW